MQERARVFAGGVRRDADVRMHGERRGFPQSKQCWIRRGARCLHKLSRKTVIFGAALGRESCAHGFEEMHSACEAALWTMPGTGPIMRIGLRGRAKPSFLGGLMS